MEENKTAWCNKCKKEVDSSHKFCGVCGTPVQNKDGMTTCSHCRKEISALADKCPYCQSDLHVKPKTRRIFKILGFLILGLPIVLILLAAIFGGGSESTSSGSPPPAPSPADLQKGKLDACLSLVQNDYSDAWDAACKDQGKPINCKLSSVAAGVLDNRKESAKNDCYRSFPQ